MITSPCKAAVLRIRPSGQVKALSALGRRLTYRMRIIIVASLLSNVWGSMHRRCIHHSGRTIPRPPKSLRNRSLHMAYARLRLIWPSSSTVICSCAIILPSACEPLPRRFCFAIPTKAEKKFSCIFGLQFCRQMACS